MVNRGHGFKGIDWKLASEWSWEWELGKLYYREILAKVTAPWPLKRLIFNHKFIEHSFSHSIIVRTGLQYNTSELSLTEF